MVAYIKNDSKIVARGLLCMETRRYNVPASGRANHPNITRKGLPNYTRLAEEISCYSIKNSLKGIHSAQGFSERVRGVSYLHEAFPPLFFARKVVSTT